MKYKNNAQSARSQASQASNSPAVTNSTKSALSHGSRKVILVRAVEPSTDHLIHHNIFPYLLPTFLFSFMIYE